VRGIFIPAGRKIFSPGQKGLSSKNFQARVLGPLGQIVLDLNQKRFKRGEANSLFQFSNDSQKFPAAGRQSQNFSPGVFPWPFLWILVDML
jgi:hypothetical protein